MTYDSAISILSSYFDFNFPSEWVKAALVLSFFSTCVVIGVFSYLNRFTKKSYFSLWTVSWIFFAIWLTVAIQMEDTPTLPWLVMARRSCLGISALFMLWGSFELTGSQRRRRRELVSGVILILAWNWVAAYVVTDRWWVTLPMFALLALACIYTGQLYLRLRNRYRSAGMLAIGFMLTGAHLFLRPFIEQAPPFIFTLSYVITSILAVFIALSMIVQVLEQGREQNETLLEEFKRGMAARRMLEHEVTINEQKYRALFDSASDAFFLVDLETLEVLEYNQAAHQFIGDRPSDGLNRSFLELCPSLHGVIRGSLLENKRMFDEVFGESKEFQMTRVGGATVSCEGDATLVPYNKRSVLQVNVREITERKQLEQQLRRSEKLGALGQLTAGVAHELNNPLAVIMGYTQVLSTQCDNNPKLKGEITRILRESERAAKIVRNLLTFARPREPQMLSVDLNRLVANILETYEAELESTEVTVRAELIAELPRTVADPHQIEQVLANLVVNALQSMQDWKGTRALTLATEKGDRTVRISVADTGPGIPPEIVTKIFDPFFTTKPPGKGTGLGLSISHSIIHEHRGRIWVESELGKGAKFFIELPLIARTAEEQIAEAPVVAAPRVPDPAAASYRLLLVDDEPGIVEVMAAIFSRAGYTIDTASNGNDALDYIQQNSYDVILSDLCMPGLDGEALYRKVKESDPDLAKRIIFVTGDTVSTKSRSFLEWSGNRWLNKPFNITELEDVVVNFLRQRREASTTLR